MAFINIKLALNNLQSLPNDLTIRIDDSALEEQSKMEEKELLFLEYMKVIIQELDNHGNIRTSETYRSSMNSLRRFLDDDVPISRINKSLIKDYEKYLLNKGIKWNTISFYMRTLRAVYNRAVDHELVVNCNPFRNVYTGIGKTKKRAVSIEIMQNIKNFKPDTVDMEFARDMFMFSFYAHGMSFIDMAYLKFSDIKDGILTYKRKKTGQQLKMEWNNEMDMIANKWKSCNGLYVLPIIKKCNGKERNQFRYMQYKINKELNKLGKQMNPNQELTMYVARHSWASIAQKLNIPIEIISNGMGHDSERTTRIYLKGIETCEVDNANMIIIDALKRK